MEMTVIAQRSDLIGWYERRGYARTGDTPRSPTAMSGSAGRAETTLSSSCWARTSLRKVDRRSRLHLTGSSTRAGLGVQQQSASQDATLDFCSEAG